MALTPDTCGGFFISNGYILDAAGLRLYIPAIASGPETDFRGERISQTGTVVIGLVLKLGREMPIWCEQWRKSVRLSFCRKFAPRRRKSRGRPARRPR